MVNRKLYKDDPYTFSFIIAPVVVYSIWQYLFCRYCYCYYYYYHFYFDFKFAAIL